MSQKQIRLNSRASRGSRSSYKGGSLVHFHSVVRQPSLKSFSILVVELVLFFMGLMR
jgi:hypothetical protein